MEVVLWVQGPSIATEAPTISDFNAFSAYLGSWYGIDIYRACNDECIIPSLLQHVESEYHFIL